MPAAELRAAAPAPARPLTAFSVAVLAEFIRWRGISYFPEELLAIEERLSENPPQGSCGKA